MISSPTAITPAVSVRNYDQFCVLVTQARTALEKAIRADETRPSGKKGVLVLYEGAVNSINTALRINASNCPVNKRVEVEKQTTKLQQHLAMIRERTADLERQSETTTDSCSKNFLPVDTAKPGSRLGSRASSTPSAQAGEATGAVSDRDKSRLLKGVNAKFGEDILTTLVERTDVRLTQIHGNEAAKRALEESVIFPALNPQLFTGLRAPAKGILLYGPPGNGKTMLAKAVANEARSIFFNVSAATIMSKWVGDGEKMVQALFQIARNGQPAIIFIDEIDSLLCERQESENGASRRVKTEFLLQFDGCTTSGDDRVLVLGATNRPQDLDDGVLRRFGSRVFIDLPDEFARSHFMHTAFAQHNTPVQLTSSEWDEAARMSAGYSFSDLMAVCRAAAMQPIQQVRSKFELSRMSAKHLRPVSFADMVEALKIVAPSTNQDNLKKLREFAGVGGGPQTTVRVAS